VGRMVEVKKTLDRHVNEAGSGWNADKHCEYIHTTGGMQ